MKTEETKKSLDNEDHTVIGESTVEWRYGRSRKVRGQRTKERLRGRERWDEIVGEGLIRVRMSVAAETEKEIWRLRRNGDDEDEEIERE